MSEERCLVLFDTDHIKNYLFATNKLKEIRGASALLDRLNATETEKVARNVCPALDKVYANGGGALFLAPSADAARDVMAAVEKLYVQKTLAATITGAALPLAPATEHQGFGERVQELGRLLRRAKAHKAAQPGLEMLPYLHICDACGEHPAACRSTDEEGLPRLLCRACQAKRKSAPAPRQDEPEDFEQLGGLATPIGYMGFIYADGNCIGKRLEGLGDRTAYAEFSENLRTWLGQSLDAALGGTVREGRTPYIKLLLGGDDLLLVTAADIAMEAALKLAQEFETRSGGLTLSVGVVLAHADYPIAELLRLAGECLKRAKACSFKAGYKTGAIDFEIVTSASGHGQDTNSKYQNRRPYLLCDLVELLKHVKKLQQFPSSQLQTMYESLHISPETATMASLQSLARVGHNQWLLLRDFFRWSSNLNAACLPPWCAPGERMTALGDLVELLPFVPERSG